MPDINFTPFPALKTKSIILRKLTPEDVAEVYFLRSDPIVQKYIRRAPAANKEEAEAWIKKMLMQEDRNETINWGIAPHESAHLIGLICLWKIEPENEQAEVGYSLHPAWFGKGIMREALTAVTEYGFNKMKLKRIDAYTNKDNLRSQKLLEGCGFSRNKIFEGEYGNKEELEYNTIYTLLK